MEFLNQQWLDYRLSIELKSCRYLVNIQVNLILLKEKTHSYYIFLFVFK